MTVHKSQGSEFSAVVLPTVSTPPKLSYVKSVLYSFNPCKKFIDNCWKRNFN